MADRTFQTFMAEVEHLLSGDAAAKGYSDSGPDGSNVLYEFVAALSNRGGVSGHALGETVYKLQRYGAKHQDVDLLKAAAWVFLLWRFHKDPD